MLQSATCVQGGVTVGGSCGGREKGGPDRQCWRCKVVVSHSRGEITEKYCDVSQYSFVEDSAAPLELGAGERR